MSGIAVYMEGGGRASKDGKARLRQGMAEFIRKVVSQKRLGWKVVACGSRNDAHDAFQNANRTSPEPSTCFWSIRRGQWQDRRGLIWNSATGGH